MEFTVRNNNGTIKRMATATKKMKQENRLKNKLKQLKWEPTHYLEMDNWISPYTFIDYSFENAIQIEDLK